MRLPGKSDDEVRFGVAIAVPEPHGGVLQSARAAFGDPLAALIPPHVTLLGPTVRPIASREQIDEHLREVASRHEPFELRLRGTGTFRPVSPVVFVQVVTGIAGCEQLEADVRSGILGERREFNYHPHVTVAHELDDAALDLAFERLADFDATFDVSAFWLFDHGPDDEWRPVREYPLGE